MSPTLVIALVSDARNTVALDTVRVAAVGRFTPSGLQGRHGYGYPLRAMCHRYSPPYGRNVPNRTIEPW